MRIASGLRAGAGRAASLVLPAQVFAGGAAVMALELVGSRLLAPRFGSTIYVWGSLIGVVMLALALGAHVGGRRADMRPTLDAFSRVVFLAGLAVSALPFASGWVVERVSAWGLGIVWGPLVASFVLLAPPTFLLGMATPFAVRLSAAGNERAGRVTGNVYALSTAGSIAGTFATAFLLIPHMRVPLLVALVGVVLLAVALAGMRERWAAGLVAAVVVLASPAGFGLAERVLLPAQSGLVGETLYEADTAYHRLIVGESSSGVRTLLLDGLRHGTMYVDRPNETSADYVYYFHLGRAFNPNLTNVLFIGGGAFSGPKKFLEAYPNASVDVVEIDPEVVRVADEYFEAPLDDPRVRVFTMDGRRFLREAADREYDLVILDAYSRTYVPFHLMTAEFFFELSDRLAPGGVVVTNLIAATRGEASDILKAEVRTLEAAFRETYVFPVRGAAYPFAQNVIVVATDERERSSPAEVRAMAEAAATPAVPKLPQYADRLWEGLDTFGAPLLRDDFSSVDILLNPVTRQPYAGE